MARGKPKSRYKKKKKKAALKKPPLSPLDKCIHGFLWVIAIALPFVFFFGWFMLYRTIALSDSTVICSDARASVLWCAPMLLFIVVAAIATVENFRIKKQPFFGLKDFPYGSPGYTEVYPLFRKKKYPVLKPERPSHKKFRKQSVIAVIICFAICTAFLPFSLFGRDVLHEDMSISVYNAFNSEIRHYEAEDVTTVNFSIRFYAGGRYSSGGWRKYVTLTTYDGKRYQYRPDLDTMLEIKAAFPASVIAYEGTEDIDEYILDHKLDADEIAKLYDLFNVSP
ncbi:MAG: hypothetical protein IJW00_09860 [Clostridia bacterium]|nr:hypothetical protein [Clostridia bacterium]